jgi:hypothetical protein
MPVLFTSTAAGMPHDKFHRPTRLWPTPRQKPYLEQKRERC